MTDELTDADRAAPQPDDAPKADWHALALRNAKIAGDTLMERVRLQEENESLAADNAALRDQLNSMCSLAERAGERAEAAERKVAELEWATNQTDAEAIAEVDGLRDQLAECKRDAEKLRNWLDNNTTFYDVDADWPVEGPNIPTLAQVSERIWYHATDDTKSYPFSAAIDAAIKDKTA